MPKQSTPLYYKDIAGLLESNKKAVNWFPQDKTIVSQFDRQEDWDGIDKKMEVIQIIWLDLYSFGFCSFKKTWGGEDLWDACHFRNGARCGMKLLTLGEALWVWYLRNELSSIWNVKQGALP